MSGPALYEDATKTWGLVEGDALIVLARLPDSSVDAVVTAPPYGIAFADERWDGTDIQLVAAASSQETFTASEAFERWTQLWARECRRVLKPGGHLLAFGSPRTFHRLVSGVEDAGLEIRDQLLWIYGQGMPKSRRLPGGLGTNLKPAYEPVLLTRRPIEGTTAENLEAWGTGALNIDASRVGGAGYWPANLALSHGPGCTETDCTSGCPMPVLDAGRPDRRPSRLFFCAKATKQEREAGCDQIPARLVSLYKSGHQPPRMRRNTHRTVKPIMLMRWLVKLATPPGGIVLDPFAGSGSTGIAAVAENRSFLGIEREGEYVDVACARLTHWTHQQAESL